jgi:hypothetical protein
MFFIENAERLFLEVPNAARKRPLKDLLQSSPKPAPFLRSNISHVQMAFVIARAANLYAEHKFSSQMFKADNVVAIEFQSIEDGIVSACRLAYGNILPAAVYIHAASISNDEDCGAMAIATVTKCFVPAFPAIFGADWD